MNELAVVGELGNLSSNIVLFIFSFDGVNLSFCFRVVGEFDNENCNSCIEFDADVGEHMVPRCFSS